MSPWYMSGADAANVPKLSMPILFGVFTGGAVVKVIFIIAPWKSFASFSLYPCGGMALIKTREFKIKIIIFIFFKYFSFPQLSFILVELVSLEWCFGY